MCLLFLASIFLPATYYLYISLPLMSFYSISVCDHISYSLFSSHIYVSHLFFTSLISTLAVSLRASDQWVQSLFVALLASPFSLCFLFPIKYMFLPPLAVCFDPTFSFNLLTSISYSLCSPTTTLRTALAVPPPL